MIARRRVLRPRRCFEDRRELIAAQPGRSIDLAQASLETIGRGGQHRVRLAAMMGFMIKQMGEYFPPWLSVAVQVVLVAGLGWMSLGVFNRGEDDSGLGATNFNWRR